MSKVPRLLTYLVILIINPGIATWRMVTGRWHLDLLGVVDIFFVAFGAIGWIYVASDIVRRIRRDGGQNAGLG